MKRIYVTIGILFIVLAGLAIYVAFSSTQGPSEISDPVSKNSVYNNLRSTIEKLSTGSWDKDLYDGIMIDIRANREAHILDGNQAADLKHLATLHYIEKLNEATRRFFRGICDDLSQLAALNRELIKLYNNKRYADRVNEMRRMTSKVYQMLGYRRGTERRGWTNEVRRFVGGDFDEERAEYLRKHILEFLDKPYLGNCTLVRESVKENMNRLNDAHFKYLETKVADYVTTEDFDNEFTFKLYREIEKFREMRYISDIEWVESKSDSLVLILYEHQQKYEQDEM